MGEANTTTVGTNATANATEANATGQAKSEAKPQSRPQISDEVARNVAWWISDTMKLKPLEMHSTIGQLIVSNCYDNDLRVWHERNTGDQTLEKIVEWLHALQNEDMNETRLVRSVGLYEQELTFGPLFKRWRNLKPTHYFATQVLPLDMQPPLLQDADEKALTVEELAAKVDEVRPDKKRSRKPEKDQITQTYREVDHLRRVVEGHDQVILQLRDLGMDEGIRNAFHGVFDKFVFEMQELTLNLHNMGAVVPAEQLEKFTKDHDAMLEAAKKAYEAKKEAEAHSKTESRTPSNA